MANKIRMLARNHIRSYFIVNTVNVILKWMKSFIQFKRQAVKIYAKKKTLDEFWEILFQKITHNSDKISVSEWKMSLWHFAWKSRSQVSLKTCTFYSHHFHLKHITDFWQKLRKRPRPTSQMFSDVCSLNSVRSDGSNQVPLCNSLPSSPWALWEIL